MVMSWFLLVGSMALVWTMPEQFAAEQKGAFMIINLQMLAFCLIAAGRGLWFLIKERATVGQMVRDLFN